MNEKIINQRFSFSNEKTIYFHLIFRFKTKKINQNIFLIVKKVVLFLRQKYFFFTFFG